MNLEELLDDVTAEWDAATKDDMGGCGSRVPYTYEVRDPKTGEVTTSTTYKPCNQKTCPDCGPNLRRCFTAHYIDQFEAIASEPEGDGQLWFLTLTCQEDPEGSLGRKLKALASRRRKYLDRLRYRDSQIKYLWVAETGARERAHLHLLVHTHVPKTELKKCWHGVGAGMINHAERVRDKDELVSVVWYMSKEQFCDPERGEDGFPNHQTNGHSNDVEGYTSAAAKQRRAHHARREVVEKLLNDRTGERPICDWTALKMYLLRILPDKIRNEVVTIDGKRGWLIEWSEDNAVLLTTQGFIEVEPFKVLPIDEKLPRLYEGTPYGPLPNPAPRQFAADKTIEASTIPGSKSVFQHKTKDGVLLISTRDHSPVSATQEVAKDTRSGLHLSYSRTTQKKSRISTPMAGPAGTGLKVTPRRQSRCLVVFFEAGGAVRPTDAFVLSTVQAPEGDTEDWGAPGDVALSSPGGAEVLLSQGGVMDLQADPWARQAFLPSRKAIKQWAKTKETLYSPLAHDRTVHDETAEVAFREFALNSRFMHREGDLSPNIFWATGSAQGSEKASAHHPQAGALSYFRTERRDENGEPTGRYTALRGGAERLLSRQLYEDLTSGALLEDRVGTEENSFFRRALEQGEAAFRKDIGAGITEAGEVLRREIELEEASLIKRRGRFGDLLSQDVLNADGEEVYRLSIFEDGRLKVENPEWTLEATAGGALSITNGDTTLELDGEDIYIGQTAGSESEPIALGQTLVQFLEAFKQWANSHTHSHPMGRGVSCGNKIVLRAPLNQMCPSWDTIRHKLTFTSSSYLS